MAEFKSIGKIITERQNHYLSLKPSKTKSNDFGKKQKSLWGDTTTTPNKKPTVLTTSQ